MDGIPQKNDSVVLVEEIFVAYPFLLYTYFYFLVTLNLRIDNYNLALTSYLVSLGLDSATLFSQTKKASKIWHLVA